MQRDLHPPLFRVKVVCSCGYSFFTRSTRRGTIECTICSRCHPFFTGEKKIIDQEGRVEKFVRRQQQAQQLRQTQAPTPS